jgi:heat-inducible transcriptional repressor
MGGESDSLARQPVEVGRGSLPVAVAAHHPGGVVIGDQEQEIRVAPPLAAAQDGWGHAGAEGSARKHAPILLRALLNQQPALPYDQNQESRPASMTEGLSRRSSEVLRAIVQTYVETGEPVASRTIARRRKEPLSPATIRNIMSDLAEMGYLEQPHTSAGRVPTAKAFAHYAAAVAAGLREVAANERMREELARVGSPDECVQQASHLLTSLTRNVGIAAAIPASAQQLDQIDLIRLPDRRILMIVVTRDGLVHNQVAHLPEPVTQDDLQSIRNFVNQHFAGWQMRDIRAELDRMVREERAAYDLLLGRLQLLHAQGLLSFELPPRVYLEGASNLLGLDLHITRERLRELFHALEEKQRLIELLDQYLDGSESGLQFRIGLGEAHPALREFALIGIRVEGPGGLETRLAVLGPMRMHYPRVMSAVVQLRSLLKSLPQ